MESERRLAAIVVADVVGYSALMEKDEADTLARLFALRTQLIEPAVTNHGGHIVKTTGDGVLAEFASAVRAVEAAIAVQEGLAGWPDVGEPLQLRIGAHVGDVAVRDDDIYGDGVNVAARLEGAAPPGGILISSAVHDHIPERQKDAFADAGYLLLKNISRPIHGWQWGESAAPGPRLSRGEKPSIAVLTFESLSDDPEQEYIAEGIVEDLTTSLSRFHWFRVISRSSTRGVEATSSVGAALGVRYILEGSVRRAESRIRVTVHLDDVDSGTTVWADTFDREMEDLFDVQDEIVGSIVGAVGPEFVASFQPGGSRTDVSSWELAMRGWNMITRLGLEDAVVKARLMFEQALEVDEGNTLAHSGLAYSFSNPYYQAGYERDVGAAVQSAQRALEIDDHDAFAWCLLGVASFYGVDYDAAERALKRSIAINPSLALAHIYMAIVMSFRGKVDAAEQWTESALRLSPADPSIPMVIAGRAIGLFAIGDYEGALALADRALSEAPDIEPALRLRAASLEMMGLHKAATKTVDKLLALAPVTLTWARGELTPLEDPEAWSRYLEALRQAGVPE